MSLRDLLESVTSKLGEAGIPYMLTGSLAASFHGAPRATQDIDLVVEAPLHRLLDLGVALRDAGMYVSDDAIQEAHETSGMFNAIDPTTGWKIDFIVRKDRSFSEAEFRARKEIELWGLTISIASAEDMVIAKLEWAQLSDSERQLRDVAEIMKVQGPSLDCEKVERWVKALQIESTWSKAQELADESRGGQV